MPLPAAVQSTADIIKLLPVNLYTSCDSSNLVVHILKSVGEWHSKQAVNNFSDAAMDLLKMMDELTGMLMI